MSIEHMDAEIARLQAELGSVERAPRTIAERYAEAEARLRKAEGVYRQWGFDASAGHERTSESSSRTSNCLGAWMG